MLTDAAGFGLAGRSTDTFRSLIDPLICETRCRFPGGEQTGGHLASFFGLVRISENLFADYALRGLAQILIECTGYVQILGPERAVDKGLWCANQDGRVALPRISVGT